MKDSPQLPVVAVLDSLAEVIDFERPDTDDVLAVLIRAILSQATNGKNRDAAFDTFITTIRGDWNIAVEIGAEGIEETIRVGGLAKQKSQRIHKILQTLRDERDEVSLEFIKQMETDDALSFLLALPGVGYQSATFTLGWAAGHDLCPINTGVKRVTTRLGWLTSKSDQAQHRQLHGLIPEDRRFEAHMLFVRHARTVCGLKPSCDECACSAWCDFDGA